jgi:hypothetical protein
MGRGGAAHTFARLDGYYLNMPVAEEARGDPRSCSHVGRSELV